MSHVVVAVLSVALSAAGSHQIDVGGKPPASGKDGLLGTTWRAVQLVGKPVGSQFAPDNDPHLVFSTDGSVSGADGCNRFHGPYTVKGEAIAFGLLAVTGMACVGNADEVSRRFQSVLKGTGHWRITNGKLEFYGATGKPLAVFERKPAADK